MAIQKTMAAKSKKQPKQKRSLRKKTFAESRVSEQENLAINLDKSQLDAIFTNLYLGNLQNPQMALGLVYSLALDALEKTLIQGIDEFIHSIPGEDSTSQNPFAPFLGSVLPREPAKISAFQNSIVEKISAAKKNLQERIEKTYQADASGKNLVGKKLQFSSEAIRTFFDQLNEADGLPCSGGRLSNERLQELFNDIQMPLPDDGIKRFHITQTPDHYRFSFGNQPLIKKQTDSVRISSDGDVVSDKNDENTAVDMAGIEEVESGCDIGNAADSDENNNGCVNGGESEQSHSVESVDRIAETIESDNVAEQMQVCSPDSSVDSKTTASIRLSPDVLQQTLGITHEQTDTLKSEALDIMNMAVEVSETMKKIAVQIAQATMEAFNEEQFVPSLSVALQNDPRMQADAELSEFVELLESDEDEDAELSQESSDDDIDNDELANAFELLLEKFDF